MRKDFGWTNKVAQYSMNDRGTKKIKERDALRDVIAKAKKQGT